ncbi:DoxX family protein [Rahnella perminowiae]|uniref:DoxX family protein n=1 Tax=Rahnella perminowiae TaxID=2816244 RepID=UPI00365D62E6
MRHAPVSRLSAPVIPFAVIRWLALLALCAAYLQGGIVKLFDFPGAIAEMQHFGLSPAAPMAAAVIVLELAASALILTGRFRRAGALALALFTFSANFMANAFWQVSGQERAMMMNGFFEHIGLAGAFIYVAWDDLKGQV